MKKIIQKIKEVFVKSRGKNKVEDVDVTKRNFLKLAGGFGLGLAATQIPRSVFGQESKGHTLYTDIINERTSAAGVTIDGVLIKDGNVDSVDVSAHTHSISQSQSQYNAEKDDVTGWDTRAAQSGSHLFWISGYDIQDNYGSSPEVTKVVTVTAGRAVVVVGWTAITKVSLTNNYELGVRLVEDALVIAAFTVYPMTDANTIVALQTQTTRSPSAGSHTYKVQPKGGSETSLQANAVILGLYVVEVQGGLPI